MIQAKHILVGSLGEDIAERFLKEKGFTTLGKNYREKWGEIDIIAQKGRILHFVEVKTVSREKGQFEEYNPFDNIHKDKIKRIFRTVQSYIVKNKLSEKEWQIDAIAVFLNQREKRAKVEYIENIVLN